MLTVIATLVPLVVGGVIAWFLRRGEYFSWSTSKRMSITGPEFVAVGALIVGISLIVTTVVGPGVSKAKAASGYLEFWNGSIVDAWKDVTTCTRDGACRRTYSCDPYIVMETYTTTDSKGNTQVHTRPVTHYHSCPYATKELSYFLQDSLDRTITIAANIFEADPKPWRAGRALPTIQRGVPPRWARSAAALKAGDAEPVTMVNRYVNYILPSENDVLRRYGASISRYRKAKLLPDHTVNLRHPLYDYDMQAKKIQFIGGASGDLDAWNDALMRFNAALGSERQGDLHVVVVPADKIEDPDDYIASLVAHWVGNMKKWGLPKNAIALVIGVDGDVISWARAKTGMPIGNNEMTEAIALQLAGKPFKLSIVLGRIKFAGNYQHGTGILDRIMFTDHPFKRACMRCEDKKDVGTGFVYLKDSIPVSPWAELVMGLIVFTLSAFLWLLAVRFDPFASLTDKEKKA